MSTEIKILIAQINPLVAGIEHNSQKIIEIIKNHQKDNDIIVFPELILSGYLPNDLLFHDALFLKINKAVSEITSIVDKSCTVILGYPLREANHTYNALSLLNDHKIIQTYYKQFLPNYGVFDEKRYFTKGKPATCTFTVKNTTFGVIICEDLWQEIPVTQLVNKNVNSIICINCSPFDSEKLQRRKKILKTQGEKGCSLLYVNQTGAQDDVLFDGQSMAVNHKGELTFKAHAFQEELQQLTFKNGQFHGIIAADMSANAIKYEALKTGLYDYVTKNNFKDVLVGASGGIDSALTLAIAADALGAENVHGVILPSRFNSTESHEDAVAQLNALNINYSEFSIEPFYNLMLTTLKDELKDNKGNTTENIQARIRMLFLMALSNQKGNLVLNTSNKSEIAVGYSTIYGDLAGSFAVLKDVYKTEVYALAQYRNSISLVIPERVITKEPTAELNFNQKDTDSLPEYDVTDGILKLYIEKNLSTQDIINAGFKEHDVNLILARIKQNEYKRYQAPPGSKISPRAFGADWRYPLTSGFDFKK